MRFAPDIPSTATLHKMHPLSSDGERKVTEKRQQASTALKLGQLTIILGPCAMNNNLEAALRENSRFTEFGEQNGITVLHRLPPWKPRTDPDAWHGLDTSDPEMAHRIATAIAEQNGNLAMEFGHPSHIRRFVGRTALAWRGSRNDHDNDLLTALEQSDPTLPIAIKNGMGGQIDTALHAAKQLQLGREAPSVLLFRGGEQFDTPQKWTLQLQNALEATNGMLIVDAAHGGEMAHDPNKKFGKSEVGQLDCLDSIMTNAIKTGVLPRGIMIETSDEPSPTDPVIPIDRALEKIEEVAFIHRKLRG